VVDFFLSQPLPPSPFPRGTINVRKGTGPFRSLFSPGVPSVAAFPTTQLGVGARLTEATFLRIFSFFLSVVVSNERKKVFFFPSRIFPPPPTGRGRVVLWELRSFFLSKNAGQIASYLVEGGTEGACHSFFSPSPHRFLLVGGKREKRFFVSFCRGLFFFLFFPGAAWTVGGRHKEGGRPFFFSFRGPKMKWDRTAHCSFFFFLGLFFFSPPDFAGFKTQRGRVLSQLSFPFFSPLFSPPRSPGQIFFFASLFPL